MPKFLIYAPSSLNTTSAPGYIQIYATDANGSAHYVTEDVSITLLSSSPSVAALDSATVTIATGNYYNYNAHWAPGIVGTAQLSASDVRAVQYKYSTGW